MMPDALPRVHETVVHMLADAAATAPDATALVCGERRLSYAEYLRCVAGFAGELVALGARGSRVALVCGNSIEMAIATFAAHAAGAQAAPVNPMYTARELRHILPDAAPAVVVYDGDAAPTVEPLMAELGIANGIRVGQGGRLLDAWRNSDVALPQPLPRPDDLASLQYTGGTTGLPKGVELRHGAMAVNISQREALLPTRPDDESILCVMPLFHVFAVSTCLHLACYARGKLVILPRYKPDAVFAAIAAERVTRLPAGPTVFIGLMAHERFASADFASLRCCYSGAAALPEETLRRWRERVGTAILEGYGQSEAGPVISFVPEGSALKPGSVGLRLPMTEVEIVDPADGVTPVTIGEIRVRGPQVMSGYRNRPEETAEALRDGWLYTGDIGEFDDDGWLHIRDRKKDMAIVGGYNVYPREVDDVLYAHPDVAEVATVGLPDAYRGEVIKAFVVPRPGARPDAEALLDHCRSSLAKYKVPVAIEFLDQLPRTTVGKVDKRALRNA